MSLSLARSHTRTVSVRWAVWNPLVNPSSQEVVVSMVGGPLRAPDDEFVYRMPQTEMQDEDSAKMAGGLISFQCSLDGKVGSTVLVIDGVPLRYNSNSNK